VEVQLARLYVTIGGLLIFRSSLEGLFSDGNAYHLVYYAVVIHYTVVPVAGRWTGGGAAPVTRALGLLVAPRY